MTKLSRRQRRRRASPASSGHAAIDRVFALCGGHIMPIWMRLDAEGISIVDVRDERAAVHMAQAHAELTGELGVALVTAGPGGHQRDHRHRQRARLARAGAGALGHAAARRRRTAAALQDLDAHLLVRSITRYARTVREPSLVLAELDEAIARALGEGGEPGPAYFDFPVDTLRADVPKALQLDEHFAPSRAPRFCPIPTRSHGRSTCSGRRGASLVISGRGAQGRRARARAAARPARRRLPRHGREPRPGPGHASRGGRGDARRRDGRCRRGPDGRPAPRFPARLRLAGGVRRGPVRAHRATCRGELRDNRRGAVEIQASPAAALKAIVAARPATGPRRSTRLGREAARERTRSAPPSCAARWQPRPRAATDACIRTRCWPRSRRGSADDAIVINDGGDFLSVRRASGCRRRPMLDPGPLGCIGVGAPYGIAASLAFPSAPSWSPPATAPSASMRSRSTPRCATRRRSLIVVANNGAWQIEVHDQQVTHGKVVGHDACSSPTTPRWRAPSACMASASSARRTWRRARPRLCQPPRSARRGGDAGGGVLGREVGPRLGARSAAAGRMGRGRAGMARKGVRS